jgi:hypothetical protein
MSNDRVLAVFVAVLVIGCTDRKPTTTEVRAPALSRAENAARPISGTCQTSFAPPTLPPPPVIRQVDEGSCNLSHLGKAVLYSVEDIDVVAGTQRSVEFTLTAANGDILRVTTAGTNAANATGVDFAATMRFVGGTGRFANAAGEAQVTGAASFITNTATFTVNGWIEY